MFQNTFKPFSEDELPQYFNYPVKYLELSKNLKPLHSIPYFSWWFYDAVEPLDEIMEIYFSLTGRKNLIVFARDSDWAACFDATDYSGNPKVLVYDLGNRENHYEKKNFDEWLKFIISEI
ncbi:hypothetical protein OK024_08720 [Acinetobacter sp. UGAL515B_02]|uniref:hypothetical protein n=1 Tax=Acinetobacter soli TaxID=487316 RepID=UPI000E6AD6DC|nr:MULTISPECIES: hypothetical protein [Acinetobacter]WON79068.1 hypothetical protein OK024_08720 [Acinetobacter sp. UGAL515B_02]